MENIARKAAATILTLLVLFFTVLGILAVWEVVPIERFLSKTLSTLLILFVSSAIILFLFAVVFKEDDPNARKRVHKPGPAPSPSPSPGQQQTQQTQY